MGLRPTARGLCVYVRLRPGSEPLAQLLAQCREALLLLHALAVVDNSAFQDLLIACRCANLPLVVPGVLPSRFEVRLGDSKDGALGFDTELYREFFALPLEHGDRSASPSPARSSAFAVAMDAILAKSLTPVRRLSPCAVHLRFIPRRAIEPEHVVPYLTSVNSLVRELQQAVDQAAYSSHPAHTSLLAFPFGLENVEVHASRVALPHGASATLAQLLELERPRVKLYPFVDLSTAGKIAQAPLYERAHVFRALTGASDLPKHSRTSGSRGSDDAGAKSCAPLHALDITNERDVGSKSEGREYLQTVGALCSALVASQKIDELQFNCLTLSATQTRRTECWQWLAYALLSKDSAATVSKLAIHDEHFRRKDMRAIMHVLEASNPAAVLWKAQRRAEALEDLEDVQTGNGSDHGDSEQRSEDQVDARELVDSAGMDFLNVEHGDVVLFPGGDEEDDEWSEFTDDEESEASGDDGEDDSSDHSPVWMSLKPGSSVRSHGARPTSIALAPDASTNVRVMHDDREGDASAVTVLVPGVGPCSAQRASVECVGPSESATLSSRALGYQGAITSLSLSFTLRVTASAVLPLIQYLGPQLTALELLSSITISSAHLREILYACPRLTLLAVPDIRDSAELELLAAYEAQQCHISDLRLCGLTPSDSTAELIRRLSDTRHRISKCVRHLTLVPNSLCPLPSATSALLVEMLQRNKALESLQVQLSREDFAALESDLMRFHGESLPFVKVPVPLASRMAFLSVLQALGGAAATADRAVCRVAGGDANDSRPLKRARRECNYSLDLKRFDTSLVALIFGFAAEPRVREIHIACL